MKTWTLALAMVLGLCFHNVPTSASESIGVYVYSSAVGCKRLGKSFDHVLTIAPECGLVLSDANRGLRLMICEYDTGRRIHAVFESLRKCTKYGLIANEALEEMLRAVK